MASLDEAADEFFKDDPTGVKGSSGTEDFDKQADDAFKEVHPPIIKPVSKDDKPAVEFGGSNLQFATPWKTYDTGIPISGASEKALAQFGSGVDDWRAGYNQIMGKMSRADVDEKRKIDDPLNKGFMGTFNNLMGKALPVVAGAAALPVEGAWAPAAAIGAGLVQGAAEPLGTGENRAISTAVGGLTAGIPTAAKWLAGSGDAMLDRSVDMARRMGIPVTIADATTNPLIRGFRSLTDNIPILNRANRAVQDAQEAAFTSKVGEAWGNASPSITKSTIIKDADDIGKQLKDIYMRNDMPANTQFDAALDSVKNQFGRTNETIDKALDKSIENLRKNIQTDKNGFTYLNGEDVNSWQMQIGADAQGDTTVQKALRALRNKVLDHYQNNLPQQTSDQLGTLRQQYRAVKAVEDQVVKNSARVGGRTEGVITPADLSKAVESYAGETAPAAWENLAHVGKDIVQRPPTSKIASATAVALPTVGPAAAHMLGASAPVATSLAAIAPLAYGANRAINSPYFRDLMLSAAEKAKGPLTSWGPTQALEGGIRELAGRTVKPGAVAGALKLTDQMMGNETEEAPFRIEVRGTRNDSSPEEIEAADRELALRRLQRGQ